MESSVIETVAKYFFFSCLDEKQSFSASLRVLADLKRNDHLGADHRAQWIATLTKWRSWLNSVPPKDWSPFAEDKGMETPAGIDLHAWSHFLANAEPSEVEAVLFSKILRFSDEDIAAGLSVTVGTVRYRVGRGLRHLGGYIES